VSGFIIRCKEIISEGSWLKFYEKAGAISKMSGYASASPQLNVAPPLIPWIYFIE